MSQLATKATPAAVLLRVSTLNQAKLDKQGLPEQRRAAYAYAEANDFKVVAEFSDVISGASEARPAFYEMLSRSYEFKAVIVSHTDRLARDLELGLRHMRLIREAGLELHSAARGLIEKGIVSGVDMLLGEHEKERIKERTQNGLIAEAREGKLPNGLHLFGYHNVPGQNRGVIDPDAAAVVRRVFALGAQGLSYRAIAREMMATRTLTPLGKESWYQHTVRRMICNSAYKGEFVWTHKRGGRFVLPVPPIVSVEAWAKAQRHKRGPPVQVPLPLSGRLRCGRCGAAMGVRKVERGGKYVYLYYRCGSAGTPSGACGAGLVRRDKLEPKAEILLRDTLQHPDLLRDLTRPDTERDQHEQRRLDDLGERAERVKEMRLDGLYSREEARIKVAEIDAERRALTQQDDTEFPLEEFALAAREMPFAELLELTQPTFYVQGDVLTLEF